MTEMSDAEHKFILHWGEMGAKWGINRTVGQVHALLFLADRPLNADEIAHMLKVARSNVSGSLRELELWGVVRPLHILGDRRTHYEAIHDSWQMARTIIEQRKKREVDPTLETVRTCLEESRYDGSPPATQRQLADLVAFLETVDTAYREITAVPPQALRNLLSVRGRMRRFVAFLRDL